MFTDGARQNPHIVMAEELGFLIHCCSSTHFGVPADSPPPEQATRCGLTSTELDAARLLARLDLTMHEVFIVRKVVLVMLCR